MLFCSQAGLISAEITHSFGYHLTIMQDIIDCMECTWTKCVQSFQHWCVCSNPYGVCRCTLRIMLLG